MATAGKSFKDPVTSAERQILFGRDAREISDSLIGFINRDEQITSKLPSPMVTNSLGRNFMQQVSERINTDGWTNKPYFDHMCSSLYSTNETVPGFMTLWFVPSGADEDRDGFSATHQSYLSKWMAARNLDNMVKNWQPGDMQFVDVAIGYIKMYLSVATRALLIMRDVAQRSENRYYNKVGFLKAMGFNFTEKGVDIYYENLWSYFNKAIVSLINSNAWLKYSYPGINRWAALCEAVYRDTPAKTDYAQMYVFMPLYMAAFGEEYDTSVPPKKIGWTIDIKGTGQQGDEKKWYDRYGMTNVANEDARGYQGFMRFLDDLHNLITFVFYNDDVKDIIATLNAIAARNLANDLSSSGRFNFQRLEFGPDNNTDMSAPVLYDSAMLIAIANATICPNVTPSQLYVAPASGRINQTLHVNTSSFSSAAGYGPGGPSQVGCINMFLPKVLNFPNFNPTQCDLINATQWTVSLSGTWTGNGHSTDDVLPAWAVGSDYIAECTITRIVTSGEPFKSASYQQWPYYGVMLAPYTYTSTGNYITLYTMANDIVRFSADYTQAYEFAQQFSAFPACYRYTVAAPTTSQDPTLQYMGPVVQSDVYWIADGSVLSAYHEQWKANFWGFPIFNNNGSGAVNLTVGPSSSNSHNTDNQLFGNDPMSVVD